VRRGLLTVTYRAVHIFQRLCHVDDVGGEEAKALGGKSNEQLSAASNQAKSDEERSIARASFPAALQLRNGADLRLQL
jgi:hypothetical protein